MNAEVFNKLKAFTIKQAAVTEEEVTEGDGNETFGPKPGRGVEVHAAFFGDDEQMAVGVAKMVAEGGPHVRSPIVRPRRVRENINFMLYENLRSCHCFVDRLFFR